MESSNRIGSTPRCWSVLKGIGVLACIQIFLTGSSQVFAQSDIINNDTWWKDTDGNDVLASMGGHITKVGDTYYWVGNDQNEEVNGPDIRLYSSKTLGSGSWKFETLIADLTPVNGQKNCTLLYNPSTDRYVVISKGITFYRSRSNDIRGPYDNIRKVDLTNFHPNYESGGMSAYREGSKAYIIVSMKIIGGSTRYVDIYELTPDFLNVIPTPVLSMPTARNREAYWLFVKDGLYYMSYDGPGGWKGSDCYYRTATSLAGPWSAEVEIGMDPVPTTNLQRSHASQHRWIMKIGDQWVYGGDRYPYKEPSSHPPENGLYIFCPVVWNNGHPTVKWEQTWSLPTPVSPFSQWANLNTISSGPDGNDDGDNLANLYEFALGGDPHDATDQGVVPTFDLSSSSFSYSYRRRKGSASGLTYIPQFTHDLTGPIWSDSSHFEVSADPVDDTFEIVTLQIPITGVNRLFVRLKVLEN